MKPKAPAAPAWRDELPLLSKSAGLLLGCLALAALLLVVSSWLRARAEAALADAVQVRAVSAARFQNVEIEKQELALFAPRFAQLQATGMIGDENRLAWIETVKQIQTGRRLISASYEVEPQQAVVSPTPLALGDYQLRASRMRLELGMVHELDLFNVLGDLRNAGRFTVQDCQVKRKDVPLEAVGLPRLTAACTLVWLTLGGAPQPAAAPLNKGWP